MRCLFPGEDEVDLEDERDQAVAVADVNSPWAIFGLGLMVASAGVWKEEDEADTAHRPSSTLSGCWSGAGTALRCNRGLWRRHWI